MAELRFAEFDTQWTNPLQSIVRWTRVNYVIYPSEVKQGEAETALEALFYFYSAALPAT